jgi:hypothetical protein
VPEQDEIANRVDEPPRLQGERGRSTRPSAAWRLAGDDVSSLRSSSALMWDIGTSWGQLAKSPPRQTREPMSEDSVMLALLLATTENQVQAYRPPCHLRAIPGGLWRLLAVTHGHSVHFDLYCSLYRSGTTRMVRMGSLDRPLGPHRGHTPPESHGQHRTTAATQHRSSAVLLDQHRRSTDHPTSLSHGGSQGSTVPSRHVRTHTAGHARIAVQETRVVAGWRPGTRRSQAAPRPSRSPRCARPGA